MTESSHSQHRVFLPGLYPPENEIPRAVASSHVVWRGEGAVIAVPSLLFFAYVLSLGRMLFFFLIVIMIPLATR